MIIRSLKVEEGFFNNLNLTFSDGLNVLVGGRGVGKTSVIELIRFGLGAKNFIDDNSNKGTAHALSILNSTGQVCIELQSNSGEIFSVTRMAQDKVPWSNNNFNSPIIFSQTEIETIGLNKESRMALIDSFIPEVENLNFQISQELNELKSLCTQYDLISKEYRELSGQLFSLEELEKRELELSAQHQDIQEKYSLLLQNQNEVKDLQQRAALLAVDIQNLESFKEIQNKKIDSIRNLVNLNQDFQGLRGSRDFADEMMKLILNQSEDNDILRRLYNKNISIIDNIEELILKVSKEKMGLENTARLTRNEFENKREGAGSILSELGRIREQIAKVKNIKEFSEQKKIDRTSIYHTIQQKIVEINKIKEIIFNSRLGVVNYLNDNLNPIIKININPNSDFTNYIVALENSLRGSGLKYKELLETISEKISPAWLIYYSITEKYDDFSKILGIPFERSVRLLGYLSDINLGEILSANVQDTVDFSLLDHGDYKSVRELSIGQRCTVVLSIILENKNRVLIIDQPEDHLDNEFIVNTLIRSIQRRTIYAQTIVSSHNANIPVLGGAKNVINLESNGRKGFVRVAGDVNKKEIKSTIESIMEGGKEAFKFRSIFYNE
ncbi:AAA family ATPase [Acinetobacter baumannii]|uniref:AAA family ATPase n=1 Tax=Acinetobacter baumannii TaxID=470 RepID=UPI0028DF6972|nr:AAA family ATPase [Acinetobacter baumannii]MDT8696722.1 AAA family ATPase [Acinetobacter baumannii]